MVHGVYMKMLIWRRGCAFIIQVEFIKTGLDFHSKCSKQVWYFNAKFWIQISEIYSFTGISEIFEIIYLLNYRRNSCKFKYMSSNQICSEIYAIFQSLYYKRVFIKVIAAKIDCRLFVSLILRAKKILKWFQKRFVLCVVRVGAKSVAAARTLRSSDRNFDCIIPS